MGNYEQKWIDIGRVWSLSAQQFVPALHVCMYVCFIATVLMNYVWQYIEVQVK